MEIEIVVLILQLQCSQLKLYDSCSSCYVFVIARLKIEKELWIYGESLIEFLLSAFSLSANIIYVLN